MLNLNRSNIVKFRIAMDEQQKKELLENFHIWSAGHPRDWQDEIPHYAQWYIRTEEGDGMNIAEIISVLSEHYGSNDEDEGALDPKARYDRQFERKNLDRK